MNVPSTGDRKHSGSMNQWIHYIFSACFMTGVAGCCCEGEKTDVQRDPFERLEVGMTLEEVLAVVPDELKNESGFTGFYMIDMAGKNPQEKVKLPYRSINLERSHGIAFDFNIEGTLIQITRMERLYEPGDNGSLFIFNPAD